MNEPGAVVEASLSRKVHAGLILDVSFRIGAEIGIVFGPSGAGKTTLLRLIAGLERPDSGSVRVGDATWFDAKARVNLSLRTRGVGMIFQDDLLFPHRVVKSNIGFGLLGWNRESALRRVAEIAELCGVSHLLNRRPESLSGGERQRVGLARSLAPRPRLLLCDEPVSALDLDGRYALLDRLRRVQQVEHFPLLYVTHSPAEAIALGSTLFLLAEGKILDRGAPLEVLARRTGAGLPLEGVRNLLRGRVAGHAPDLGESYATLDDGPGLIVPLADRAVGDSVTIAVRADDILLARGPIAGLSARNIVPGRVAKVVPHGGGSEVVVHTGGVAWIVSVVASAVAALELREGADVRLILKARSCHVL